MSPLWRLVKGVAFLAGILLLAALAVALLPPWWGKPTYMIHLRTGIPYGFHFEWPPHHFTGIWRDYGPDKSYEEFSYKDGLQNGPQRYYDKAGLLVRECEFRDGEPWSGLCNFRVNKSWLAEYRGGKVWTGAMDEPDETQPGVDVMRYHYHGKLVDEGEFRSLMGFGTNGGLYGVHWLKWN